MLISSKVAAAAAAAAQVNKVNKNSKEQEKGREQELQVKIHTQTAQRRTIVHTQTASGKEKKIKYTRVRAGGSKKKGKFPILKLENVPASTQFEGGREEGGRTRK